MYTPKVNKREHCFIGLRLIPEEKRGRSFSQCREDEIGVVSEVKSFSIIHDFLFSCEFYTFYYVLFISVAREKSSCVCVCLEGRSR